LRGATPGLAYPGVNYMDVSHIVTAGLLRPQYDVIDDDRRIVSAIYPRNPACSDDGPYRNPAHPGRTPPTRTNRSARQGLTTGRENRR
jgi:hypothetical protein